jgi:hypothetical protein
MKDRPKEEAKDRPALKASPINNMLLFTEFKLALVRFLFYVSASQPSVIEQPDNTDSTVLTALNNFS